MKKLFILSVSLLLTACACMDSEQPQETEVVYRNAPAAQDCDYFDGNTCYKYRSTVNRYSYGSREVVRYREPRTTYVTAERDTYVEPRRVYREPRRTYPVAASSSCSTGSTMVSEDNTPCKTTVRETREPVEVVYKKTTYRTVYEPKTYQDVSYEKEPFNGFKKEGCTDCL